MRTSTLASLLPLAAATLLLHTSAYAAPPPSDSVRTTQTIYTFPPFSYPGTFLQAPDGSFYGVTKYGRSDGYGTLYRLDPSGNFLTLHEFGGDTGAHPSLVALAADGRLYGGSTGLNDRGSVYRIEPNRDFQLLHEFTGDADGSFPNSLVAGSDGNIYGFAGGALICSFFRIRPDGTFELVRSFPRSDEINYPRGLVEAANGELYGFSYNQFFQISRQGATTIVHSFPSGAGTGGLWPGSLAAGMDGNIYGTTPGYYWVWHGTVIENSPGSVFRCTPTGEFQELHSFPPLLSGAPSAVVQANSHNIYGISGSKLSRVTVAGQFDDLYLLGSYTYPSALIQGVNGDIYGLNYQTQGPDYGAGTLFRVVFGQPGSVNLSSRMQVGTGDSVAIGGFIITGNTPKKVMVRGIGTSLASLLPGSLSDPVLELHESGGAIIARNDNWRVTQLGGLISSDQSGEIQASGLAPTADRESALIATLQPGNYTAVVSGTQNGTGIGLYEVYDLDIEDSRLANISTRGFVDSGNKVMIGGLIVDGSHYSSAKFVFRAIGPSLSESGTANALQDPSLVIYNADGTSIATNDNWRDGQQSELIALGLAPRDDREAALVLSVIGGRYTAVVSGRDGTTGVALVEVYNIP